MSSRSAITSFVAATLALATVTVAQESVSPEEAAQLAFAGCELERETLEFTEVEREHAAKDAHVDSVPATVVRYVARRDGKVAGTAYVDTRRVRTKAQQLLVVLDADDKVRRIEILAWQEPQRYRPKPEFYAQFVGRKLDATLRLRRGVRPVTGATLSAVATVDAVRTVLAVHEKRPLKSPVEAGGP